MKVLQAKKLFSKVKRTAMAVLVGTMVLGLNTSIPTIASSVSGNVVQDNTNTPEEDIKPVSTSEYLVLTDNVPTPTATYGQDVNVIVSVLNLGTERLEDLIITPVVDASVSTWPFEITTMGYSKVIPSIPGNQTYEKALENRREVMYTFKTRSDVLSGYYPLNFEVKYNRNGATETTKLTTFVKTVGAPGSGTTDSSSDSAGTSSKPRVIVTGFETNPSEVYAGDTFTVTIHLKNTSKRTAISNMQIDLNATPEGTTDNKYEAFLPTSGSNTIYIDRVGAGGNADIQIEMTAKADLTQKPYALEVKMEYEDDKFTSHTSSASVSIPIKQASKLDTSSPEVMPESIEVGNQSNVMFSIYNVGKTTLYNVQVKFVADSVSGGDTFVGKIDPGATGNVDAMVTGMAATMDEGIVKAVISYEDDAGNVTTLEKDINLYVMEAYTEMNPDGMWDEFPVEETKSFPIWAIIIIIVVVIGIGIAVFLILKKKRKNAKELSDDLDSLDDLDLEEEETNEMNESSNEDETIQ